MLAVALLLAQASVSDGYVARAVRKARPVAECRVGADCAAKWTRARQWILENSTFAIARETDSLIVTHRSGYANVDASFAVVMDPPRNGARTIRLRIQCGNDFGCQPTGNSLRRLFRQAMQDAR